MKNFILICVISALLVSCANMNSIHRQRTLSSGQGYDLNYVSVDAKQRLVLSAYTDGKLKVCAEYMPDIFSVLSSSLSGQAGYGLGEDTKDVSVKVAQALSESGATIRRSQTVNLLALSMYKTCERYLSGAINADEMIIQAVRDQRMLVTVLAIEQLTDTAHLQAPTLINSGPVSASTDTSTVQALEKAKSLADTQKETTQIAQKAYEDHLKDLPTPDDGKAKSCALISDTIKAASCKESKSKYDLASSKLSREESFYQGLLKAGSSAGGSNSTPVIEKERVSVEKNTALSDNQFSKLADTVLALATLGVQIDEEQATCNIARRNLLQYTPEQLSRIDLCNQSKTAKSEAADDNVPDSIGPSLDAGLFVQLTNEDRKPFVTSLNSMLSKYFGPQFRTYPAQVLGKNVAPSTTEIRYFFDQDRSIARNISIALTKPFKAAPRCRKIAGYEKTARAGVLELWIADQTPIGDVTPESKLSFAQTGGAGCAGQ
nr:hypothetical protein [uncultured Pseudomonas sp.]